MQYLARVSVLLVFGSAMPAMAEVPLADADDAALLWCLNKFPKENNRWVPEDGRSVPPPTAKLRPFDRTNAIAPADLVTSTKIDGELPLSVEKYRGLWTWPTVQAPPPIAVFVERLTATEMTIATAFSRKESLDEADYQLEHLTLSWAGTHFAYSKVTPEESRDVEIHISPSGEAMLMISGFSELVTLQHIDGKVETGWVPHDAWPVCFISERYFERPE